MTLTEPEIVLDEGTVVLMSGYEESTGRRYNFAVDWRSAQAIVDPNNDVFEVEVEAWQVLGPA